MSNRLTDVVPEEVSLVSDGAVAEAEFVILTKSASEEAIASAQAATVVAEDVVEDSVSIRKSIDLCLALLSDRATEMTLVHKEQLIDLALSMSPAPADDGLGGMEERLCKHVDAGIASAIIAIQKHFEPIVSAEPESPTLAVVEKADVTADAAVLKAIEKLSEKMGSLSGQYDQLTKKVGRACGQG